MSAVGSLLRSHRDAAGLTQEELADRAGVSARTVSDIERGLRSRLYADTAGRLAAALCLTGADREAFTAAARGRSGAPDSRSNLPRPITALVGRNTELLAVTDALAAGRRLVTITGLGGIGKTRLALAGAERAAEMFAGRLHFLLVPVGASIERFGGLVATAVGASDLPSALGGQLRGRPTLLVLDSFEHALPAAAALEQLLLATPDLYVIVTSREPLQIIGEYQVPLAPLAIPDAADPSWDRTGAARLFLDRARDVAAQLEPDRETVIEICRRLSGLPLALELAATRLRYLPLDTLRDRLHDGFPDTNAVEEILHRTVESLSADAGRLLRACALLPGGWRVDAVESVAASGTALDGITELVDKGLVHLVEPTGESRSVARWQMLDVVRGFVLAHTAADDDAGWRRASHSFYVDLLTAARAKFGQEREWFHVFEAEEANLRTLLDWAAEAGDAQALLELANGMWFYWQSHGALVEGRHWLDLGLRLTPPADDRTRMTALWGNAMLAHHQGADAVAERHARELRALATSRNDDTGRRHAATILGMVAIGADHPDRAVAEFGRALELAMGIDDPWLQATSHLNLGLGLLSTGRVEQARTELGEALGRYEQLNDERFRARCVGYLGMASLLDGDAERSRSLYQDSLRVFHRLGEPGGTAEALTGLAACAAAIGNAERAAVLAAAAERLRQSVGARQLPLDKRTNDHHLGLARAQLGDRRWAELSGVGADADLDDVVEQAIG